MKRTTMVEPVVAAVFGHVGAGQDADRRADRDGEDRQDQAADDRIEQAAGGAGRRRHLGEDREREAAEALPEQRAQDQHQPAEAEQRGGERQAHHDGVAAAAGGVERVAAYACCDAHCSWRHPIRRSMRSSM